MPARVPIARSAILLALLVCIPAVGGDSVRQPVAVPPAPPKPVTSPLPAMDALAGPAGPADLDVMTFNLRYAGNNTPNAWPQRRPVMRNLLTTERPDLIGIQEGLDGQLKELDEDLGTRYRRIGRGRNSDGLGEHAAIYFDETRLQPQRHGHYWLSSTPEVPGSISWGTAYIRMVTWVLFLDTETGRRFCAVNTHLDNHSEYARREGARLITERLADCGPVPTVLTGDFNSPAGPDSVPYRQLTENAHLRDTWAAAARQGPVYATFHGYRPLMAGGPRVDWILTSPDVTVLGALINTHHEGAQFPSDHLPVQARLRLG
ncbi:metal-dependent hydrolase [Actinoplanes italicus]|uniref:Endonuclease/exonuclease/phosphatase family metal-dependent hydrolase n=1 Tax=Actinoplanes italicus TaxID=113567 RepID=A0A2T0KAC6_9ACTN|nr:endonuclease/exonuclease/phosphatase family protein [Actinoplanes italicus]PRX20070.1 endonuclease/exonuclease/phosphatase family metal-dependent hydrolase [Actinoplanes italicus]GIE31923.1 metal-dependent hydrolase [Actinoplanes italicus]